MSEGEVPGDRVGQPVGPPPALELEFSPKAAQHVEVVVTQFDSALRANAKLCAIVADGDDVDVKDVRAASKLICNLGDGTSLRHTPSFWWLLAGLLRGFALAIPDAAMIFWGDPSASEHANIWLALKVLFVVLLVGACAFAVIGHLTAIGHQWQWLSRWKRNVARFLGRR